jgi:steroid 5-alpha reductase family enzyme
LKRSILVVTVAYFVALAAAWLTLRMLPDWHPIARVAIADFVATVVVFAFSRAYDNSSLYDPYWSLAPMAIVTYLAFGPYAHAGISVRKWCLIFVVWLWGARLTYNWLRGWRGLGHEDWRYVDLRATGRAYWAVSFLGIHLFPTICTFVGCLALFPAMSASTPMHWLDAVGLGVALGALGLEAVADRQLYDHRQSASAKEICEVGVWRWSRHPNYFGECTFWVGLWLVGVAAAREAAWWTASGPVIMFALFLFVSIPMAEKRALARRPEFARHQQRVSRLIPWFRRA